MLRVARQAKILQIINERGFVENEELARLYNVTQTTIRRDLLALAEQKLIKLDHGGSFSMDLLDTTVEPHYETKVFVNNEKKRAIGMAAANLVRDDDSIFLDSGTTNAQIAHSLKHAQLKNVTVITCDLMVAKELCSEPNFTVLMLGGVLRKSYYSAYGPFTEYIIKNLTARKFFLGIDAADKDNGIFNYVLDEVPIKQLMIEKSDEVIMVSDSSKLGKKALYKVASWETIDRVITDQCVGQEFLDSFIQKNVKVTVVSPPERACDDEAAPAE
jgi:DeoR/GlpR family transcriptional regulator of sugar metabolism